MPTTILSIRNIADARTYEHAGLTRRLPFVYYVNKAVGAIGMEKRLVQSLMVASVGLFVLAIALAAVARPLADPAIMVAGRGSAGLAVAALVLLVALRLAGTKRPR